jgi:Spermine/spermidine synthase domain
VIGLLMFLPISDALRATAALALFAAALGSGAPRKNTLAGATCAAGAVLIPWIWPEALLAPQPSPYKELSLALTVPGARVIAERHGPLGELTVVESPSVPFRWAPGQSLTSMAEPPEQLAVFTDGSGMTAITRFDGNFDRLRYLDEQTGALPYHLKARPRVLVLGAGGGADVLLARLFQAPSIDAVELDPHMVELVRSPFGDFAGSLYDTPPVRIHVAEARSFIDASSDLYDIVQISLLDSFAAAAGGLHGLGQSTIYTLDAMRALLERLAPGGLLAITRWVSVPPRDPLKLFATAVQALRERGVDDPGGRLAWIRGWRTTTLLVKNGALTTGDLAAVRAFSRERGFDIAWLPGIDEDEPNRFNLLERPWFYEGASALLGPAPEVFFDTYKFDVVPATDDRPFFFHTLKFTTLLELLRMPERAGFNLVEWGYPVLLATLAQALVASIVLILLPLLLLRRTPGRVPYRHRLRVRVALYFAALGLAFLFIEMTFIQRFQLILGHPVYAVSAMLCAFLVFAGLGSGVARPFALRVDSDRYAALIAIGCIAVLAVADLLLLDLVFRYLAALPLLAKLPISILAIAPLAFCMGMPFPLGLSRVQTEAPRLLPWAWGINGCASVVSTILASLLALHFGFSTVLLMAVALYAFAALAYPVMNGEGL